ncbi:60S ribosome biogenesis protein Sqt1 [Beauveria bassiana ARSEF 2860]|uniref:60S ribosome biogenesis protein Sqt1 n=1 Tax=Beauveria bassiana (strain ARSEF 2860) TaxID=655819 RepID=J4ULX0_BEAB2|nr:60S ribosome biogenesis protein Sqt1 [Beauveria bassiana ARSEF 2860]EJP65702.1 60S ribosome biogenesis protein Sqt1 [Beauveria bassiana ARSEF 2860]
MPSDTPEQQQQQQQQQPPHPDDDLDVLAADDAAEEFADDDNDMAMDSDDDQELLLANDAIAYFDEPQDSLFAIAQHPAHPSLVAVGGSADSINALCWTLPAGEVLVSGGLDGRVRAWKADVSPAAGLGMTLLGEAQEVEEVNWIAACPSPDSPNTIALGANDGSVWVYTIDPSDPANPLQIVQSYFLHTGGCTAGTWTPDGRLLATVSEDGTLYVWDVWGAAAARGIVDSNGQTAVALSPEDQRFAVEGGLYSVAVDPKATFVAVGGAGGAIKIVSLPRLGNTTSSSQQNKSPSGVADATTGGQILASLHTQTDGVETLAITLAQTTPATVLLAAGSVDGSICVYDATRRFAVRRHIVGAHEEHSVVRVDFVKNSWLLTSCGMDGVVRRWDLRGSAGAGAQAAGGAAGASDGGLVKEWKGHRGDGEGGGVLGFVQGETGERVVTAGDDGVSLVFEA